MASPAEGNCEYILLPDSSGLGLAASPLSRALAEYPRRRELPSLDPRNRKSCPTVQIWEGGGGGQVEVSYLPLA